jgi:signal transduction histidine kinase
VVLAVILLIAIYIQSIRNVISQEIKNINNILFGSSLFFILNLFFIYQIARYFSDYTYELYALIGLPVFISAITYTIVRYKTFDIRLTGAQALMWVIGILVSSQLFFVRTVTNRILISFTLLFIIIAGILLIRSVKREARQKELLEVANNNQQILIHFISHQIKGFFTKSKIIFSGLIEGDFGEVNPLVVDMAKTGLESDDNAVAMVQDILGASNLKTGTINFNFKEIDLKNVVLNVAEKFSVEMEKKGLKFIFISRKK